MKILLVEDSYIERRKPGRLSDRLGLRIRRRVSSRGRRQFVYGEEKGQQSRGSVLTSGKLHPSRPKLGLAAAAKNLHPRIFDFYISFNPGGALSVSD